MSIKIIHTADWHLGGNYPEKAQASAEYLVAQIYDKQSPAFNPDVICLTGDLTNHSIHVHSEHLAPFLYLVANTTCPIVLLQGTPSHEPFGTVNNIAALSNRIKVIDEPGVQLNIGDRLLIAGLPALTRSQLAEWARALVEGIDGFADPAAAIRILLEHQGKLWAHSDEPKVYLGHWTVSGCVTPTGQTMTGNDLEVGLDDLALAGADVVLLGHIHQSQQWRGPGLVSYSGPPYPTSWGELHQTSFSVVEIDGDTAKLVSFVRIPMPHRPMAKFDIEFTGEIGADGNWLASATSGEFDRIKELGDVEVKCCYSVPKEIAAQVDDTYVRTMFEVNGLTLAAVERTIKATTRERIADIASKETTRDQYLAVCQAKGEDARPGALVKADLIDVSGVAL
jgi:exonuclease SbcD